MTKKSIKNVQNLEEIREIFERNFNLVIKKFDFGKVYKIMILLDWKWSFSEQARHTPDSKEMQTFLTHLFEETVNDVLLNGLETEYACESGGFEVRLFSSGGVYICFKPVFSESYNEVLEPA